MSKSDEQIERESTKKQAAAARKALPPDKRAGGTVADWEQCDAELAKQLVCVVAREGGAVRLGYTRDGGAYSIGIYMGADSKTYYCNDADGINNYVRELIGYFED